MITLFFRILYRYGRDKILHKVFRDPAYQPLMTYAETIIIEDILKNLKPKRCLEWGVGYSTLMFPRIAGRDTKWFAVEHDREWASEIKKRNKNPNVTILYVAPNSVPWSDAHNDGSLADLKDYVEFPKRFAPFDFILIDGRARSDCLIKALELAKEGSILLLHDAEREFYHQPLELYKYKFFFPEHTEGIIRLWIGSMGIDVARHFNFEKYSKHRQFLRFIFWLDKAV